MENYDCDRRKFIKIGAAGAAILISWPFLNAGENKASNKNGASNPNFEPDLDIALTAVESEVQILLGNPTRVWIFESELIKGDQDSLQKINDRYLGPIIRVRKGQKIRIRFNNQLPEKTIVHWHGMHVAEKNDGHPKDVIAAGETYIYEYEVLNRAGTYWFHPHPHGRTGPQVYHGLAGLLLVTDEEEESLNLPGGEFDIPVVIQDRTFDQNNQLIYLNGGRMDGMTGFLGDHILINGKPEGEFSLKADGSYRLRVLNGSNSRIYKIAWADGTPLTIIGIDGSLLENPELKSYLMLGVGERADLWLDLRDRSPNSDLTLVSQSFSPGNFRMGMMGRMQGSTKIPLGSEFELAKFFIKKQKGNSYTLPAKLAAFNRLNSSEAANANNPRSFRFAMQHMQWTINGRVWEETGVSKEETVKLNTVEIWELINSSGGMMGGSGGMMGQGMMQMAHPVHLHQVQFNILERDVSEMDPEIWESVKDGFIDTGWQDTVLLMPGMKIKIIMRFENFAGLFLYHCHNLEHEDMGMMRNFKIEQ